MRAPAALLFSLIAGALFGLTLATKFPDVVCALAAAGAAGFTYGAVRYVDRQDRREALRGVKPAAEEAAELGGRMAASSAAATATDRRAAASAGAAEALCTSSIQGRRGALIMSSDRQDRHPVPSEGERERPPAAPPNGDTPDSNVVRLPPRGNPRRTADDDWPPGAA